MNKYSFDLPYDYTKYASVRGFVYANSESEAREKARHSENWFDEESSRTLTTQEILIIITRN